MAIAPTASISIICGGSSPGIEPIAANSYMHKTLSGSFNVRNKYLKALLAEHGKDTDDVWSSITTNEGSVQHLEFLNDDEKAVFKTAFELDQRWIIELAADRARYICQSQSVNVFLPADIHKKTLHDIHFEAWRKGLKSLYYCRSKSLQRAEAVATKAEVHDHGAAISNVSDHPLPLAAQAAAAPSENENDYEECLSCQ